MEKKTNKLSVALAAIGVVLVIVSGILFFVGQKNKVDFDFSAYEKETTYELAGAITRHAKENEGKTIKLTGEIVSLGDDNKMISIEGSEGTIGIELECPDKLPEQGTIVGTISSKEITTVDGDTFEVLVLKSVRVV